ncbi:MAG: hypothetical protein IJU57_06470 [Clostridia bacterium]|nr:hypothetical protein [Clostridia bacterium]
MKRKITDLLGLGDRVHVICRDEQTGTEFARDVYAEGFSFQGGYAPETIMCCRLHHNRRLTSPSGFCSGMAFSHDRSAFKVDYGLWKNGSGRFLISSPKFHDHRVICQTKPESVKETYFRRSLGTPRGEAAYEKMEFDGNLHWESVLDTNKGSAAWALMLLIHGTYNGKTLGRMLHFVLK